MIDTCLCYFVVCTNPPGVFSHQNMIPQSHPLGVRRGSRELGTGSWQTGGCLVSGLMAKPALFLFAGVFLFIKNCISISSFISNFSHLLIIRSFLPTFHLPWARSKASKKRKNTNLATSSLFLSIGICKLTGVGSQKRNGLGGFPFQKAKGAINFVTSTKIIVSVWVHLKMTFQLFLTFDDWEVDEMDLRNLLIGFALDFWIYFWIGDTLADDASTTARVWGQGG